MLTDAELAEIEARCGAATKGPWTSYLEHLRKEAPVAFAPPISAPSGNIALVLFNGNEAANAIFIASTRTDVPRLVAELRRLRGAAETFNREMEALPAQCLRPNGRLDVEDYHGQADDLMCRALRELGCEKGVAEFEAREKWYA